MGSALPERSAGHQVDEAQQLRQEIALTREHLGATVEELASRANVKSRARAQAAQMAGRVQTAAAKARHAVPASARQAISQGAGTAREKWMLFSVVASAGLAVTALAIWQRRKR